MAFNLRRMKAAHDALATAADNLRQYPELTYRLNHQFIYLPEAAQDKVSVIMRARMTDADAETVAAIFNQNTCPTCNKVGRLCQCVKEPIAP